MSERIPLRIDMISLSQSYKKKETVFDQQIYNNYKSNVIKHMIKHAESTGNFHYQAHNYYADKDCIYAKKLKKEFIDKGYTILYEPDCSFYVSWDNPNK